jgi:hypothetical protein
MAQRHFLVTIQDDVQGLDVNDVQEAVVREAQHAYDHIDHGNVDVQLIETIEPPSRSKNLYYFSYRVLDVC